MKPETVNIGIHALFPAYMVVAHIWLILIQALNWTNLYYDKQMSGFVTLCPIAKKTKTSKQ